MHIEKESSKKNLFIEVKNSKCNYFIPCCISFILLYYVFNKYDQELGAVYPISIIIVLGIIIAIFMQNHTLLIDYKKSCLNEVPNYKLVFSDNDFSYEQINYFKTTISYNCFINYKVRKRFLFLQVLTKVYMIDLDFFSEDEKKQILDKLSQLDSVQKHRKAKSFFPKTNL